MRNREQCDMQGLSEPVGALIALLFVHPFLTPLRLQYMLACVGGIMVRAGSQLPMHCACVATLLLVICPSIMSLLMSLLMSL